MSSLPSKLIAFIFLILSLSVYAADEPAKEKKVVKVYKVTTTEIYDVYKYPVTIEPKSEREMYAEITGFVQNIYVTVGAAVKKDDKLMQLKPTDPRFTNILMIKSPLDGQVTQVAKKIGSHVKADDLLIQVVDPTELTIKIEIPQAELGLLQVAEQGDAQFRTIPDVLPVVIIGVSTFVDQATGTSTGQLDWDHKGIKPGVAQLIKKHIYPGMLGYVTFKLNRRQAMVVPNQSIKHEKGETKVRLVKDGKSVRTTIKLGKHLDGGMNEVTAGLESGDLVIVTTNKYIKENEEITIQKE